jgi:hypothetical protein
MTFGTFYNYEKCGRTIAYTPALAAPNGATVCR